MPNQHIFQQPYVTAPIIWHPDIGMNFHATPDVLALSSIFEYLGTDQLHVGDGQGMPIQHTSKTSIPSLNTSFHLNNVLYVPYLTKNLLYVQKFTDDNSYFFEFWPTRFLIKDQVTKKILL